MALPLPRITVVIEPGDGPGAERARLALSQANNGLPSLYIREVRPGTNEPARFCLRIEGDGYGITSPQNDRLQVAPITGLNDVAARLAVQQMEHMARWTLVVELANSTSLIQSTDVELIPQNSWICRMLGG